MLKKHKKRNNDNKKDVEVDVAVLLKKFKINYAYLLLVIFLLFGFYIRYYHIQYPVIGYHNWKVAHYITEARNFAREGFFKYGFFVPMRDTTETIREPPDGEHNDTFPTISILVGIFFKIFGESLVIARLVNIFFSLASVVVFYLLIKELFEREDFALLCAFLATINPMYVFFSHNVDVINPGLFFMLLGTYYYVKWVKYQIDNYKFSYLYLATFFVMIGTITKYTFVIIGLPILFSLPYKKILAKKERFLVPLIITGVIASGFPLWFYYSEIYVKRFVFGRELSANVLDSYEITKLIDFSVLWSTPFWQTMKSYVADNFSLIGIAFAFFGMFLFFLLYISKNNKKFGYRFVFWYFIGLFVFVFVMGYKLSGHSYHQFPIAPLIIFFIAFFIDVLATNMGNIAKKQTGKSIIKISVILLLLFILPLPNLSLYAKTRESKNRMFDTQFPGLDIAGEYMRTHKNSNDRVMHSSGQSYGVLWHADMKGYKPTNIEDFKIAENKYNMSWVFMYQWGIASYFQNVDLMKYIRNNYRLVDFGFVPVSQQQIQPLFFLFRKGGTFNETQLNGMMQNKQIYSKIYYNTGGQYEVRYIELE